jgi:hypothetical protein
VRATAEARRVARSPETRAPGISPGPGTRKEGAMSEHEQLGRPVDERIPAEWDLVACGTNEFGKRRCTYSWPDGTREIFVEGEHPIHKKGIGRVLQPGEPYP